MPHDVSIEFGLIWKDIENMIRNEYFKYYLNDAVWSAERIVFLVIFIFYVLQHHNDFFGKVQSVRHTVKILYKLLKLMSTIGLVFEYLWLKIFFIYKIFTDIVCEIHLDCQYHHCDTNETPYCVFGSCFCKGIFFFCLLITVNKSWAKIVNPFEEYVIREVK